MRTESTITILFNDLGIPPGELQELTELTYESRDLRMQREEIDELQRFAEATDQPQLVSYTSTGC